MGTGTTGRKKHLVLSLARKGFGEAILGVRLAFELRNAGDEVFFLAHDSNDKLFGESGFPCVTFSSEASPLLQLYLQNCLTTFQASSIILADYFTTTAFCQGFGIEPDALTALGVPILAIDTWDSTKVSNSIDVLYRGNKTITTWPGKVKSIYPVPFLAPDSNDATYASLPAPATVTRRIRKHLHHALGLSEKSKAVFFCSAEWQHARYSADDSDAGRRCADLVPSLVADYIERLGDDVHLVHVGPKAFDLEGRLPERYHWLPPLPPSDFDSLFCSMDLFLSANISATTISKAMVFGIPTLVLQNQVCAATLEEAEGALGHPASEKLRSWMARAAPLFPFSLWPLGYHSFLTPVLQDNPYVGALDIVDLLQEEKVETAFHDLLFNSSTRENQLHRHVEYLSKVKTLPSGAELVHRVLN